MSELSHQQLQLLDILNKIRLALTKQFKEKSNPDASVVLREVMRLEVVLMENRNKDDLDRFLRENQANLDVLVNWLMVRPQGEYRGKKFNSKWRTDERGKCENGKVEVKPLIQNKPKHNGNNFPQFTSQVNPFKENGHRQDIPLIAKAVIPAGEFMSANTLPKGTSVRKKFVPPYKKESNLKELEEKNEEEEGAKDPLYKNLDEKLVNIIQSDILEKGESVKWAQIAGLGFAKKIIHEMIVWPMLRPDIFTGMRAPPRAILLFGPPGTGKTMIGKAIASQASATFFSISASSLTSKWVGESEKLVKTLFAIARIKQPSVIFIDEIDSLLSSRSQGQQESSRRVKTQFLIELDGAKTSNNERVLIIGATNLPKQLDDAVRRRFVKRLYIPLPNIQGRIQLIKSLTSSNAFRLDQVDTRALAIKTKGFSGADLYNLCSEASMIPLREMASIENVRESQVPRSQLKHFQEAFKLVRPSVNRKLLKSFEQFNEQYGSYQLTPDELQTQQEPQ